MSRIQQKPNTAAANSSLNKFVNYTNTNLTEIFSRSKYLQKYGSEELQTDTCIISMIKQNAFAITGGSLIIRLG
jgi:hypothetical protein